MLRIKNVFFSRQKPIVENVSLQVKSGSFLGIVGPSGAGKSTLLKLIAGLLDADKGQISLDGEPILGPKDRLIPGHPEIKLVDQQFDLDIYHTVEENMRLQLTHLDASARIQLSDELLELMELQHLKSQRAGELSGGEQQRLALARALACEPKILLLDEPFAHLDAHLKRKIILYLSALRKIRKTSFVLVSHDGADLLALADQIAFFNEGEIQRLATPIDFYDNASSELEGLFFGELNSIRHKRKTLLFRPGNYFTEAGEGLIEIPVSYRKTHYYGLYELEEYLYKNQLILLQKKDRQAYLNCIYLRTSAS